MNKKTIIILVSVVITLMLGGFFAFKYFSHQAPIVEVSKIQRQVSIPKYLEYVDIRDVILSADTEYRSRTVLIDVAVEVRSEDAKARIKAIQPLIKSEILQATMMLDFAAITEASQLIKQLNSIISKEIEPTLGRLVGDSEVGALIITKFIVE